MVFHYGSFGVRSTPLLKIKELTHATFRRRRIIIQHMCIRAMLLMFKKIIGLSPTGWLITATDHTPINLPTDSKNWTSPQNKRLTA